MDPNLRGSDQVAHPDITQSQGSSQPHSKPASICSVYLVTAVIFPLWNWNLYFHLFKMLHNTGELSWNMLQWHLIWQWKEAFFLKVLVACVRYCSFSEKIQSKICFYNSWKHKQRLLENRSIIHPRESMEPTTDNNRSASTGWYFW